jgi:hypothetical protein
MEPLHVDSFRWIAVVLSMILGLGINAIAAALVLPPDELPKKESLRTTFERDGRWALLSLTVYFVLATVVDWRLWHVSPLPSQGYLLVPLIVCPSRSCGSNHGDCRTRSRLSMRPKRLGGARFFAVLVQLTARYPSLPPLTTFTRESTACRRSPQVHSPLR